MCVFSWINEQNKFVVFLIGIEIFSNQCGRDYFDGRILENVIVIHFIFYSHLLFRLHVYYFSSSSSSSFFFFYFEYKTIIHHPIVDGRRRASIHLPPLSLNRPKGRSMFDSDKYRMLSFH